VHGENPCREAPAIGAVDPRSRRVPSHGRDAVGDPDQSVAAELARRPV